MNNNVKSLLVSFSLCIAFSSNGGSLKAFTSDGCSSFPDGTFSQKKLWLTCCEIHDFDYWKGGTYDQRLASDRNLKICVAKVGQPHIAALMLAGVRMGGTPYLPTSFRWGYGWSYPKFYGKLTTKELQQVKVLIPERFKKH